MRIKKKKENSLFSHMNNNTETRTVLYVLLMTLKYYKPRVLKNKNNTVSLHKKNRAAKNISLKNDYIDNYYFYRCICFYHYYSKKLKELKKIKFDNGDIEFAKNLSNNLANEFKWDILDILEKYNIKPNDTLQQELGIMASTISEMEHVLYLSKYENIKRLILEIKKLEDIIKMLLYKMTKKIINMGSFRNYPIADKEDMCSFAMEKMLISKPWRSFDTDKSNAIFSYMTMAISNYYIQYIKKYYKYQNEKQIVLRKIMNDFDVEWCSKGISFNLSEGMDFED